MVNKHIFLLPLFLLAGCSGINWCNRMGAASSSQPVMPRSVESVADSITGVSARTATIGRFIDAIIAAAAVGNAHDIKHFAACIGVVADQVPIAVSSLVAAVESHVATNVYAAADDDGDYARTFVDYAGKIVRAVHNLTVDRKVVACEAFAAITTSCNFFVQGYTIVPLINAVRSLIDVRVRAAAHGHAILSLINAAESLAAAVEPLVATHVCAAIADDDVDVKLAAVACRVAFDLSNNLCTMFYGHVNPGRVNARLLAGSAPLDRANNKQIVKLQRRIRQVQPIENTVNEVCAICFERKTLYPLPDCLLPFHYFHIGCVKQHLQKTPLKDLACPVCRCAIVIFPTKRGTT